MAAHRTTVQSKPAHRQYGISGGEYCSLRVSVVSTVMDESLLELPLTVLVMRCGSWESIVCFSNGRRFHPVGRLVYINLFFVVWYLADTQYLLSIIVRTFSFVNK